MECTFESDELCNAGIGTGKLSPFTCVAKFTIDDLKSDVRHLKSIPSLLSSHGKEVLRHSLFSSSILWSLSYTFQN